MGETLRLHRKEQFDLGSGHAGGEHRVNEKPKRKNCY